MSEKIETEMKEIETKIEAILKVKEDLAKKRQLINSLDTLLKELNKKIDVENKLKLKQVEVPPLNPQTSFAQGLMDSIIK